MQPVYETLPSPDSHAPNQEMRTEVISGLTRRPKAIPSKYFYDERGSRLFDAITELDAYYPTRTERAIMEANVAEMAARIGPNSLLVEYGSGSSRKTRILLDALPDLAGYVPIDISREHLLRTAAELSAAYPDLDVLPVCADYTSAFSLPAPEVPPTRTVVYFPGSTIGNFTPSEARAFLEHIAEVAGTGGGLLIGVDLRKDPAVIEAAYNDPEGVTAAFNRNVLAHINRELDADFDLDRFEHLAFYDAEHGRIEMHLVSLSDQCVRIGSTRIPFREHERILTEYSYKYSLEGFAALAGASGFEVVKVWTDPKRFFSVQYLEVR